MPLYVTIPIVVVVVLVVLVLILVASRPTMFRVARSAQISAPAEVIFSIINDLHLWSLWSPYDKRDPKMEKSFGGPLAGPGASYAWNGNNNVGAGRMTIIESKPGELISMRLEFDRPFKCDNQVKFTLEPSASGTRVSWIMDGKNNFMGKAMSLVMDMDKMIGKDFEEGLANLDAVAQAEAKKLRRENG